LVGVSFSFSFSLPSPSRASFFYSSYRIISYHHRRAPALGGRSPSHMCAAKSTHDVARYYYCCCCCCC
jgi:hypothetical protein